MSRFRVTSTLGEQLKRLVPLGVLFRKPRHFLDMFKIIWKNRDNLPYAWKVITRGVCDGCALGVAGLYDWTVKGPHLCMTRLNLLRLNTVSPFDHDILRDVGSLEKLDNVQLRELGRLAYPMSRKKGEKGFTRISWEEAYRRIADRIRASTVRRIAFFVTARGVTNEIYYMSQKAARALGTNNVDNAARICHSPSTGAMKHAIGLAASTCSYKDWYGTDLLVFFGSNPANDQPVTTKYLHEAKKLGTKVAIINPYLEPGMKRYWVPSTVESAVFGTDIADYFIPVHTGGDIAFLYGVMRHLIENNWVDEEFIASHTAGFEELKKTARGFEWEALEAQSGIDRHGMRDFAQLLHEAKNAVLIWSMGITQHAFGGDGVSMVMNLGLMRGYIGRPKNGLMPIRGHSSVQGGAEMGCYATAFPCVKPVNPENAKKLSEQYGFEVPDWPGMTTTDMVEACARGELDVFYNLGGNLLRNLPDPDHVRKAMENVPLRVHQDIILNDQMFIEAKEEVILLPAQTRYEQEDGGCETTTERRILFSPEIKRQVGEARAEWRIMRELVMAVKPEMDRVFGCETGWRIREEIAKVVPFYEGVEKLRATGDMVQYGGERLCDNAVFPTPNGRANFRPVPLPDLHRPEGTFKASTRRGKQFNSLIYAEIDPINGAPRDAVLMNQEDAARLHLKNGDAIRLMNDLGEYEGHVFLAPIKEGNLQVHWPEGNVLIPTGVVDSVGGVPDYNAVVRVEKSENSAGQNGG
ncbi:MAG: FdhF/YdeP family oxidoreductase [Verrucomicrobiae bacterium]|nr:FdhF/YdeP family oxidoreductase [Verrucomicrobiae bacterium]